MTPLRNKMIRELELHRKAPGTIKQYVSAVAELARHYRRSPDSISIEEVRDFIHHLITQAQGRLQHLQHEAGGDPLLFPTGPSPRRFSPARPGEAFGSAARTAQSQ